jgi:hypothetical protein
MMSSKTTFLFENKFFNIKGLISGLMLEMLVHHEYKVGRNSWII